MRWQEEKLASEAAARKEKTAAATLATEAEKDAKQEAWAAREAVWRDEREKLVAATCEVREQLEAEKAARLQEVQQVKEGACVRVERENYTPAVS